MAERGRLLRTAVALWVAVPSLLVAGASALPGQDAALSTVGAAECAECHEDEVEVWKLTAHYTNAQGMPRSAAAKDMASKIGLRRIKSEARCTTCHYTVTQSEGGRRRAAHGVSCESCHGSARDWIEVHGKFGGPQTTADAETPAHRKARIEASDRAGMNRPSEVYDLAAACYGCHVVADEELVNVGGHPAGGRIPLVQYTQGEMRHNFARADGNPASSPARQRQLYVVARSLELEHALRALAATSERGTYAVEHTAFVGAAIQALEEIERLTGLTEVSEMIRTAREVPVLPRQREAALQAARRVSLQAMELARAGREDAFDAIAPLLSAAASRTDP